MGSARRLAGRSVGCGAVGPCPLHRRRRQGCGQALAPRAGHRPGRNWHRIGDKRDTWRIPGRSRLGMVYISKGRHLDSDTPAQQPLTQAQSRPPLICTMVTGPRTPLERLPLPPRPLLVEWRREKRPATICFCQPRTGPSSRAPATTAACEPGEGKPVGTINGCGQGCKTHGLPFSFELQATIPPQDQVIGHSSRRMGIFGQDSPLPNRPAAAGLGRSSLLSRASIPGPSNPELCSSAIFNIILT
jgi:hypothetical protein